MASDAASYSSVPLLPSWALVFFSLVDSSMITHKRPENPVAPLCSKRTHVSFEYQLASESMWSATAKIVLAVLAAECFNQANAAAVSKGAAIAKTFIATLNKDFTGVVTEWTKQLAAFGTNPIVEQAMTTDDTKLGSVVTTDWLVSLAKSDFCNGFGVDDYICVSTSGTLLGLAWMCDGAKSSLSYFDWRLTGVVDLSPGIATPADVFAMSAPASFDPSPATAGPGFTADVKPTAQYQALTAAKPAAAVSPTTIHPPSWSSPPVTEFDPLRRMVYENFYTNKKTPKVPTYSCSLEADYLEDFSFAPLPTNTSFWAIVAVPSETDASGDIFPAGSVLDTSAGEGSVGGVYRRKCFRHRVAGRYQPPSPPSFSPAALDKAPDAKLASAGAYLLSKYHSYAKVPQVSATFVGSGGEDWVLETVPVTLGDISLILIVGVPATGV
ncbi:hypothetical protein BDK51DRAFT_38356 [Blyttiomyces helicus]|uniref:Uncharacterized protein n=1 Tax=Blyttiomyces helicus TaxID=388810 RepID=A0A4P9W1L2_9FUNG|nr:hypothetical protein BDK51DRAFT_38356 [Blyttiomyces helicus]|eukprot:RKO84628.1 hypothetical protein BDK51DRAFT_38356 [Blyttiomyces helicus]